MKKCLRCNKQANLHITEVKNGKAQSLHLCETCAQEYLNVVDVGGLPEEFTEQPGLPFDEELKSEETDDSRSCPYCGITFKQFRAQGRLGCPHDYEVFRDDLAPLLASIHGGETQHVGKCPPLVSESSRRHYKLLRLRSQLKTAVEEEAYELAADLRDQIQTLESSEEQ